MKSPSSWGERARKMSRHKSSCPSCHSPRRSDRGPFSLPLAVLTSALLHSVPQRGVPPEEQRQPSVHSAGHARVLLACTRCLPHPVQEVRAALPHRSPWVRSPGLDGTITPALTNHLRVASLTAAASMSTVSGAGGARRVAQLALHSAAGQCSPERGLGMRDWGTVHSAAGQCGLLHLLGLMPGPQIMGCWLAGQAIPTVPSPMNPLAGDAGYVA